MQSTWDAGYLALMFGMWAVMMVGMMLPSAAPAILLYAGSVKSADDATARTYAFAGGYLLAWAAFSLAATLLQWALAKAALLSPMMVSSSPALGAALLVGAGLYQFTPLKQACLTTCRSPAAFITQHFRPGVRGALRLGVHHGLYCVGCCWALMLLLFAGGVMSLLWIGAITVFVLLEKLAPHGAQGGRLSGALLVAAGAWILINGVRVD
jgi:predicted metal-binding membrane protein